MKNALFIDCKRNGYGPEQCGRTLTVGELIRFLENFDEDRSIYLTHDRFYTFGSITERDITESEESDYMSDEDYEANADETHDQDD